MTDGPMSRRSMTLPGAICLVFAAAFAARAQSTERMPDSVAFNKALQLEIDGKYKEAVPLYRAALAGGDPQNALLGLERVLAELNWTDSLLAPLDTLLRRDPANPVFRSAQLRSLQSLNRDSEARRAFDDWKRAADKDPAPYREYARMLLQRNRSASADSVVAEGERALGSIRGLETEVAQVRASAGQWVAAANAWRAALEFSPELEQGAAYSLSPVPSSTRDSVRAVFLAPPVAVPPRLALARIEMNWGSAANGWRALRDLPPSTATVDAWMDFVERAEAEGEWNLAREALVMSMHARPSAVLSLRAARAAMNAGDAMEVLVLIPLSSAGTDSAKIAANYVPLHVRALATIGRAEAAQRLATAFDKWFAPATRDNVTRTVAWGWVRQGQTERARQSLAAIGPEADSSDTAGWLALYSGDLKTARRLLRAGSEQTPELALALGTVARIKTEQAPLVGVAFLALARGDTVGAARGFVAAADATPDAASTLFSIAAQLHEAKGDQPAAIALWSKILAQFPESAEAPEADLAWARALIKAKEIKPGIERLEHLILTYSTSALVPQARRELDLAKKIIP
jgi:tetratricopeptide (TPR) repeat protein